MTRSRAVAVILLAASSLGCGRSKAPVYTPTDQSTYTRQPVDGPVDPTEENLVREAEALIAAGQPVAAVELISNAMLELDLFENPRLWFVEGKAYQQLGVVDHAGAAYLMTLQLDPEHLLAHVALAELLATHALHEDDKRVAGNHYREAIRIDPRVPAYHQGLATMLLDLGESEEALRVLADASRLGDDPKTDRLLALAHEQAGNLQEALVHAERALQGDPSAGDVDLRRLRARLLLGIGRVDDALQELEQVVTLTPDSREVRIEIVHAAMKAGKPAAALVHAQWLEAQSPRDPAVLVLHGEVLLALGKIDDAILRFDAALVGDPTLDQPRLLTIDALVNAKKCKLAEEAFRDLKAHTADPAALIEAGGLLGPCK